MQIKLALLGLISNNLGTAMSLVRRQRRPSWLDAGAPTSPLVDARCKIADAAMSRSSAQVSWTWDRIVVDAVLAEQSSTACYRLALSIAESSPGILIIIMVRPRLLTCCTALAAALMVCNTSVVLRSVQSCFLEHDTIPPPVSNQKRKLIAVWFSLRRVVDTAFYV